MEDRAQELSSRRCRLCRREGGKGEPSADSCRLSVPRMSLMRLRYANESFRSPAPPDLDRMEISLVVQSSARRISGPISTRDSRSHRAVINALSWETGV